MFPTYDNNNERYVLVYSSDNRQSTRTSQELYEWYLWGDHEDLTFDFDELLDKLHAGHHVKVSEMGFDWTTGMKFYKGDVTIFDKEWKPTGLNAFVGIGSQSHVCRHERKYLNKISANLQFWVCPDCKKEL